jgi:hypothetical protein
LYLEVYEENPSMHIKRCLWLERGTSK